MLGHDRERLRIAVVAPSRHPIRQPHAGGLEAAVWERVRGLRERGHSVLLIAAEGSDFLDLTPPSVRLPQVTWGSACSTDSAYPPGYVDRAAAALERAFDHLEVVRDQVDVIDNHSLLGVPFRRARQIGIPMVTTLHTPPIPELVDAIVDDRGRSGQLVAVSRHTAAAWRRCGVKASLLPNGVDTDRWALGPGGRSLVWFGRIVPEKGVEYAIDAAARLGRDLTIAGRIGDERYFSQVVRPRLREGVTYVGALRQQELTTLVGHSSCALVTPRWDEPFGLVAGEALSTGTPLVTFDRGGIGEALVGLPGVALVPPDSSRDLAAAARRVMAPGIGERHAIRSAAIERFSLASHMDSVERHYRAVPAPREAPLESAVAL